MATPSTPIEPEKLFPFVLRSRALLVGRETLRRSKRKLHFVLITTDLSENSRTEVLAEFAHYPVVQRYTSVEIAGFFGVQGAKVVGFQKSGLAQSLYASLKSFRINQPPPAPAPGSNPPASQTISGESSKPTPDQPSGRNPLRQPIPRRRNNKGPDQTRPARTSRE